MAARNLVSCEALQAHVGNPAWVLFDCRHDLLDPQKGVREYAGGHIPGAVHAHVDRDLSGPVGDGGHGRHPLPLPGSFPRFLAAAGVRADSTIVAYDEGTGRWAGRLWWLARHHGHKDVRVLDGGIDRWKALGLPLSTQHVRPKPGDFTGKPGAMPTVDAKGIEALFALTAGGGTVPAGAGGPAGGPTGGLTGGPIGGRRLVDVRAVERYSGKSEPIDPVAGHIPGAVNLPFLDNVHDGRFLSPETLRARFEAAGLGNAADVVCYCGSGVTAAQTILLLEEAGLGTAALYPGSWSEWCQPKAGRPIERSG